MKYTSRVALADGRSRVLASFCVGISISMFSYKFLGLEVPRRARELLVGAEPKREHQELVCKQPKSTGVAF